MEGPLVPESPVQVFPSVNRLGSHPCLIKSTPFCKDASGLRVGGWKEEVIFPLLYTWRLQKKPLGCNISQGTDWRTLAGTRPVPSPVSDPERTEKEAAVEAFVQ